MQKALFLNLPNSKQIMRRYMCSYNSPTFLFQPIELISLAAIYRDWYKKEPVLLDAIAEKQDQAQVHSVIADLKPEFIISISGFECFEEDMDSVAQIKKVFPGIPFILFGHYATEFAKETMENVDVDYIIHGEPDIVFSELLSALEGEKDIKEIKGLTYKIDGEIIHQTGVKRIPDPNQLPMPAIDLLKNELYGEPFFPKPYGLIQSARGCPYKCNYCVKSFGKKLTALTPENIIEQVKAYIDVHKIKSYRFIDDTFTAVPKRVIKFCQLLIENNITLKWSCLSRPDTLDKEMLEWMKKAGCTRIYIGMESGSQKVLDFYDRNIDVSQALESIRYTKSMGFEIMGFFIVGAPLETKADVDESVNFALDAGFDFITIGELIAYPGTSMYNKLRDGVDFSVFPYKNEFKDESLRENAYEFQRYFFRRFYFNPKVIFGIIKKNFPFNFSSFISNLESFLSYIITDTKSESRKDYI